MSRDILLSLIDPDPDQPRQHFDQAAIDELAQSIAANGLAVPVLVRPVAGERFMLVHGERRWRAVSQLGWQTIPAEVRDLTIDESRWLALVENVQRADLSPLEEARAFRARLDEGLTQAELARRIGKSQSYIAHKVRLLTLPSEVQDAVAARQLSEGHARQLLRLHKDALPHEWIIGAARQCLREAWSVRRLELQIAFELMVNVPRQWGEVDTVGYTFKDLVQLEKRLAPGASEFMPELHVRTERALGRCLSFSKRIWEEYDMPGFAIHILENTDLAIVAWFEHLDEDRRRWNVGSLEDWLKYVLVPVEVFHPFIDELFKETPQMSRLQYWQRAIPWAVAYYDENIDKVLP